MTWFFLTLLAFGLIFSGVMLLKKSAKKFDLTPEQLEKIKNRNNKLDQEDQK